jgi:CRP/FNR family transcriptional regulator, cyclic AMP receptor protein
MSDNDKLFERFGKEFSAGTTIFNEGDSGDEMYVIQSGKVNIAKKTHDVEKILVTLGPGAFFGEMAIINRKPRSATAVVVEDAHLLVIGPKTFDTLIRGNVEIAVRMIKILAQRLQEADNQIEKLLLKDYNSRIVYCLANLVPKGKPVAGGTLVTINAETLAQKVGLAPGLVGDVLSKLLKAKLIREHEGGLVIHDANRLREFIEFLEMKDRFGDSS